MESCEHNARPKVSVCIVTYNQEAYIGQCLQSVVDQKTDFPFEVLVADDCSRDGTREIVREFATRYPDKIIAIFNERNLGPFNNFRQVHGAANGEYIAHLDGDDFWLPGKLRAQCMFLDQHPECTAVYTNASVVNAEGLEIGRFNDTIPPVFDIRFLLARGNFLPNSSTLYRAAHRDAILSIHDEFVDYQMHLRFASRGKLGYINRQLVTYRTNVAGSLVTGSAEKVRALIWQALHDPCLDILPRSLKIRASAYFLSRVFIQGLRTGRWSNFAIWHRRAVTDQFSRAPYRTALIFYYTVSSLFRNRWRAISRSSRDRTLFPR